ncbi:RHS repeat-associated core domain-containing protein [Gilliamella sp. Fer4-1]|uniref:RHS repeat-associated core domain-containing protein n=1 Tax=Gilliamella sp. Fer4-1 TaxID=3120242 RepID=UPI00080EE29B|nr:RHS repeat-associated core domain-containing protein [Gilliamella apicola]OCG61497.1 hypothetical protein A9G30_10440 [Gilliamella apicola]
MRLTLAGPTLKRCSNLFQTNLWQGSKLIAETDNDKHWQSYLYEPDSYRPLALVHGNAQQDNIKLYWYQNDHLGTPIALTGSLGDTLYECQYNAYGQIINEAYHQDDTQALPDNPLRFQGQYYDEETGLHYNLNRYYDPFTGRYITQDPLGILGGLNSYQYVNADPINWIDPLGLIKVENSGLEGIAGKESTVTKPATGAENAANNPKLNAQLASQEIANGHAFDKHVLQRGEFNSLGIRTREQFRQHVEKVINNPTDVRYYSDGRVVYLDSNIRIIVIRNPGKGESTAFRSDYDIGWDNYIKRLPIQKTPPIN